MRDYNTFINIAKYSGGTETTSLTEDVISNALEVYYNMNQDKPYFTLKSLPKASD